MSDAGTRNLERIQELEAFLAHQIEWKDRFSDLWLREREKLALAIEALQEIAETSSHDHSNTAFLALEEINK